MIRNVWSVLCRDIITDQETNSVTYVRCIEEGSSSVMPVRIGPVFLGTLWEKTGDEAETARFRVMLVSPDKKSLLVLRTRPLVMDRPRHRLHFRVNGLDFTEFGVYMLLLEFSGNGQWKPGARLPILIRELEP